MSRDSAHSRDDNELTVVTSTTTQQSHNYHFDLEKAAPTTFDDEKLSHVNQHNADNDPQTLEKIYSQMDVGSIVEPPTDALDEFPDGGYGWAVVASCFLANFVTFGIANIWGIFSQAFATSILEGKATTIQLMTVGSLINVCLNIFSPISVVLVRFGLRFNYLLGGTLMSLGVILAGFSTEVWHIFLTQSLLYGFGASFLYMSSSSAIPQWFSKRRATAMGISTAGTGLGGLAISPMANALIQKYGIAWAYRIIGFFCLGVCFLGAALIKDRLPSSYRKSLPIKSPIQLSMFKITNFNIWLVGSVVGLMGYLAPVFYFPKYAADIGIGTTDASNLLSILLAMSAVSRIVLGFVADRIGRLNMYIITLFLSSIFSFCIWPFAKTYAILLVFCILWGWTSGQYYALAAPITASVVGMHKLPSGLSIAFICSAISAMGTPISAAIQQATPNNGYLGIQMFDGAVYACGAFICLYLKYRLTDSLFKKF